MYSISDKVMKNVLESNDRHKWYKEVMNRYEKLPIPIGDVIGHPLDMAVVTPWWIPRELKELVSTWCKPWVDNGFELWFGDDVRSDNDGDTPYVIKFPHQERGDRLPFSGTSRDNGVALIGDVMVWMTVENPALALEFMSENRHIPVCVVIDDMDKYSEDSLYARAVDKAVELFKLYFFNKVDSLDSLSKYSIEERIMLSSGGI